jgi:transcriptional regulator of acetoin/glycerol metabolism
VVPVFSSGGELVGVLDIDSPKLNGFDETHQLLFEDICRELGTNTNWWNLNVHVRKFTDAEKSSIGSCALHK